MKTYLTIWHNSDGERPTGIIERLKNLGFKPLQGNYDFVYDWGGNVKIDDVLATGDKIQQKLNGCNVTFKLETI